MKPSPREALVWQDAVRIAGPYRFTGDKGTRRYFHLVRAAAQGILFGQDSRSKNARIRELEAENAELRKRCGGVGFSVTVDGSAVAWFKYSDHAGRWADQNYRGRHRIVPAPSTFPGHIIDDTGTVRKVLGTLPITADGCVVGWGAFKAWRIVGNRREVVGPFHEEMGPTGWASQSGGPERCYSTEQAAREAGWKA